MGVNNKTALDFYLRLFFFNYTNSIDIYIKLLWRTIEIN